MALIVLSLGSNLGERLQNILAMRSALSEKVIIEKVSPLYETIPIGVGDNHGAYYNQVVSGRYEGSAKELLAFTQSIEIELGRDKKWELCPRTADIDILLFEGVSVDSEELTIPHHALFDRRFSFEGAIEVVPEWLIDGVKLSEMHMPHEVHSQVMWVISDS